MGVVPHPKQKSAGCGTAHQQTQSAAVVDINVRAASFKHSLLSVDVAVCMRLCPHL